MTVHPADIVGDLRAMAEGDEHVGNSWTAGRLRAAADEIEALRGYIVVLGGDPSDAL